MNERRASWLVYALAVVASFAAFFVTLMLILQFKYPNLERVGLADVHPIVPALGFCALLGAAGAFLFPGAWRRMAFFASSAFWGFFFVVFGCFLLQGQLEWMPLGQGMLAMVVALAGALLGRWLAPRARRRHFA